MAFLFAALRLAINLCLVSVELVSPSKGAADSAVAVAAILICGFGRKH